MRSGEDRETRARKARDAALIAPLIGLLLLTPPVAQIFAVDTSFIGVPAVVVYVFAIWVALILIAKRLSGLLASNDADEQTGD